jgi:hypothetical protein
MAQTANEAADMLQRVFENHFLLPSEKKREKKKAARALSS